MTIPACKSSTLPSRSEVTLAALGLPCSTRAPCRTCSTSGSTASPCRASGVWTAVKIVTAVADGSGTALVDPERIRPVMPTLDVKVSR